MDSKTLMKTICGVFQNELRIAEKSGEMTSAECLQVVLGAINAPPPPKSIEYVMEWLAKRGIEGGGVVTIKGVDHDVPFYPPLGKAGSIARYISRHFGVPEEAITVISKDDDEQEFDVQIDTKTTDVVIGSGMGWGE